MAHIGKDQLAATISERLGGAIPRLNILAAIEVVCDEFADLLAAGESVRVAQFGTLGLCSHHPHRFVVPSGRSGYVKKATSVKFYPSAAFKRLIQDRRAFFSKRA